MPNDPADGARRVGFSPVLLLIAGVAGIALLMTGRGGTALQWLVAGVVMIGALVVIHEFGHFLVARLFGVGTPVFSVGIGRRLWGFQAFETDFRLSMFPLGGYVQMSGADPYGEDLLDDDDVDPDKDFTRKPVWQRLLIMLAGPAMNLALPYALFTAVAMLGEPVADAIVGHVSPGSDVERAGLAEGDRVVAIDGDPVDVWGEVADELEGGVRGGPVEARPRQVTVDRAGQQVTLTVPASAFETRFDGRVDVGFAWQRLSSRVGVPDPTSPAARAGLRTGDAVIGVDGRDVTAWVDLDAALADGAPHALRVVRIGEDKVRQELELTLAADRGWSSTLVPSLAAHGLEPVDVYAGRITPGSAAEQAGVRPGDRIVSIDGTPVLGWDQVIGLVARTATEGPDGEVQVRALDLGLIRDGAAIVLSFTPTWEREIVGTRAIHRPLMGIGRYPDAMVNGDTVRKYYAFGEALARAHEQVKEQLALMGDVLWNMSRRELGVTEGMGGPVAIFRIAGESAAAGVFAFVGVMGMISLSLGVVNLLPIPVLDGGHILFYAVEAIRGRPLPLAWRERIQMMGVLVLAALFVAVTVSDLSDWLLKPG